MKVNSPLQYITGLFAGGSRAELARMLDVSRSTVSGWDNEDRRAEGMCGTIPSRYMPKVLRIANERGITIDIEKIFPS